jgi:hypothetical protein
VMPIELKEIVARLEDPQEGEAIAELLELLMSLDFGGDTVAVELQRATAAEIANRLIAAAATQAAAIVHAKILARGRAG